ncbi:hypothetical protein B9T64_12030 [Bacillus halotolerans]|nr:hypothetical protein AU384_13480 [Bacillus halotolerans]OEC77007.1 hypothetical protein BCV60_08050 [Bacillus halotolerans]PHI47453.1 hypothetical protein B9T64_12030 [Bacillus halotolerans]
MVPSATPAFLVISLVDAEANRGLDYYQKGILQFCGIKKVNRTLYPRVKHSSPAARDKWLRAVCQKVMGFYGS